MALAALLGAIWGAGGVPLCSLLSFHPPQRDPQPTTPQKNRKGQKKKKAKDNPRTEQKTQNP